jgi:aspartyl-tRNA synthetase
MQRRWNYKSSVDKFYDQDDLSAWAKTTGAKGDDFFLSGLPIKQERKVRRLLRVWDYPDRVCTALGS